jgi:hypothetical protein
MVIETSTFLYDLQMITVEDRESQNTEIACPRIPRDTIFATGGYCDGNFTDLIEMHDIHADQWIMISSTQIYSYCALLNNACKRKTFLIFAYFYNLFCFICIFKLTF